MFDQDGHELVEHRRRRLVAEAVDLEKHRTIDPGGQRASVLDREDRIGGAVHDECRLPNLAEPIESAGRCVHGDTVARLGLPTGGEFGSGEASG